MELLSALPWIILVAGVIVGESHLVAAQMKASPVLPVVQEIRYMEVN